MYNYKEIYTIDFSNVKYYSEVHTVIKEALDFPDYYGENWDAFWDCITDLIAFGEPLHIEIFGLDVIEKLFDNTANVFIECLREAKHYYDEEDGEDSKLKVIEIVDGEKRVEIQ